MSQPKKKRNKRIVWTATALVGIIVAVIGCLQNVSVAALNPDLVEKIVNWFVAPTPPLSGAAGEAAPVEETVAPAQESAAFPTSTPAATETPQPSPTPFQPTLCCLAGWDAFSTDGLTSAPAPLGGCANVRVPEIGLSSANCAFVFGQAGRMRGVYGVSIPIQSNAEIKISMIVTNLQEGEVWLAFSKEIDPQINSLVYAMTPDPGGVSVFLGDMDSPKARYPWQPMGQNLGWTKGQPWRYDFTVQFDGVNVAAEADDVRFASEVAPYASRLFVGYRAKSESAGFYLNAKVEHLSVAYPVP